MLSLLMILCVFPAMSSTNVEQFGLNIVTSFEQQLASLSLSDPYRNPLEQHVAMLKRFRRSTEASESESVVEGIRSKLFSIAKPVASPIAVFLGGGMAAGKSSITKEWQNLFSPADGFVLIDVDAIMMELPDYKKILNTTKARCAAVELHHKAGAIGTMFLNEALKSGRNLVYDGTLTTVSSVDRLDKAIEANHSVVVIGVTCETHTSLMRAAERAKRIGRYVAACDLIDTHKKFSRRFMSYAAKRLKDIRLYDTSYNETLLVVQKDTVKNWTLFDKFTWKAIQTVDEVQRNLTGEWLDQYDQFHSLCGICKKTGSIGNVEQRPISEPSDKPTQKNSENSEKFPKIGDKESEIGKQQNAEGSSSKGEATKVTDLFINEWKMPLRA